MINSLSAKDGRISLAKIDYHYEIYILARRRSKKYYQRGGPNF